MEGKIWHGGYVLPDLARSLKESAKLDEDQISQLLAGLSYFCVESSADLMNVVEHSNSFTCVVHNLILRGTPTFLPLNLEKILAEKLGYLEPIEEPGKLGYTLTKDHGFIQNCWHALHVIDPRLNRHTARSEYRRSWEELDSKTEENFLFNEIPSRLADGNGDFLIQLFQPQRGLDTMVEDEKVLEKMRQNFQDQRADFVLEFPYADPTQPRGICIEVDGPHHLHPIQQSLDNQRDIATREANWHPTVRFPVGDFYTVKYSESFAKIQRFLDTPSIQILQSNYSHPLHNSESGRCAMQLTLTPFAIARIQLTVVKAILAGRLSLDADVWRIAVLERDVPCARLSLDNLTEVFQELIRLAGSEIQFPGIELKVFATDPFLQFELHKGEAVFRETEIQDDRNEYDLFIDISTLERPRLTLPKYIPQAKVTVTIRTAFHKGEHLSFLSSDLINYAPIWNEETRMQIEPAHSALQYFLCNIFRKESFRPGQLPILQLALQGKSVIGLLPTGGGKSLTYQIAGLLQPGLTLVIDPIKSLMKDQVDSLARMGINRTVYINSSLKGLKKVKTAHQSLEKGHALFCFVSPERMQMASFRKLLGRMYQDARYFAYAVIDEVHCVSEWGHDFRTSYLSLGKNLIRFCKAKSGPITLFGLTATASYDVLADVQRELSGNIPGAEIPDEQIVRHENTNRDEIQFYIDPVQIPQELLDNIPGGNFTKEVNTALGEIKKEKIRQWLLRAPEELARFQQESELIVNEELIKLTYSLSPLPTPVEVLERISLPEHRLDQFWQQKDNKINNAALVFAPHRTWHFGVTDKYVNPGRNAGIYDSLNGAVEHIKFGTFMGVDDQLPSATRDQVEEENINNQEKFLKSQLDVMVSTKAFGMGIDKDNIRFIVHANYPGSIESYVQEAGRAGRDRKMALSVILFTNQSFTDPATGMAFDPDFEIQYSFHRNNFKGIRKEKLILLELLDSIQAPPSTNSKELARKLALQVEGSVDEEIVFSINYSPAFNNLWLNDHNGRTYGAINLVNGYLNLANSTVDIDTARLCLSKMWQIIREQDLQLVAPADLDNWLNETNPIPAKPGIQYHLDEMDFNEQRQIYIPFRNDLPVEDEACRTNSDTDKAIYRLSLIGVIDDYTVDYPSGNYQVTISKKRDGAYREHLRHYISKFYAEKRVNEIIAGLDDRKGETEIQRILSFLIEFLYEEIAKKRLEAIKTMKRFCELGMGKGGNVEMKTEIHLYFNSKYARKGYTIDIPGEKIKDYLYLPKKGEPAGSGRYNVSLLDWTETGKNAEMDWVFDFMRLMADDKTGAQLENLKHLRGACTRLLNVNPDNFTLRFLRAYTYIHLAEKHDPLSFPFQPVLEDLEIGLANLLSRVSPRSATSPAFATFRQAVLAQINEHAGGTRQSINEVFEQAALLAHVTWTSHFAQTISDQLKPVEA